jgi:hypothetical protein
MRYRVVFVIGLAIGYVLGSRAGRERYEQIKRLAQRVADNPKIQEAAGLVGARASQVVTVARDRVGEKMPFVSGGSPHRNGTEAAFGEPAGTHRDTPAETRPQSSPTVAPTPEAGRP